MGSRDPFSHYSIDHTGTGIYKTGYRIQVYHPFYDRSIFFMRFYRSSLFLTLLAGSLFSTCSLFDPAHRAEEIPYKYPPLNKTELSLERPFSFTMDPDDTGLLRSYHLPRLDDSSWILLNAPGSRASEGIEESTAKKPDAPLAYRGYVWYRKWITVPPDWEAKDLEVNLGRIDGTGVCFWNGFKIGETTSPFQANRFNIPKSIVKCGEKNILAVRVLDQKGAGGIIAGPLRLRPIMPWEHLSLRVESPNGIFVFDPNTPLRLDLVFMNPLNQLLPVTANITVRNFEEVVAYRETFPLILNNQKPTLLTLEMPPFPQGHYNCQIDLYGNNLPLKTFQTSFAAIGGPLQIEKLHTSPFGVCGGDLFHLSLDEHQTIGQIRLSQQARLGALWGRNEFLRAQIEPERGHWDFAKADSAAKMFQDHKIQLLGILGYSTDWMKGSAPSTEEDLSSFGQYVEEITRRYSNRIHYWEVWNEPNTIRFRAPKPEAREYVQILKTAYTAIKKVAPEKQVIGMATNLVDLSFIEDALKMGAGDYTDIISIHPYQNLPPTDGSPSSELGKIRTLSKILQTYNCPRPLWITECGWQTQGNMSERTQAVYLVKFHVLALAEGLVEKIYWYNLTDSEESDISEGRYFGLVHKDQTPKPSYVSYYTMVEHLHDFISVKRLELSEGVYGFDFIFQDRHKVRVLWTEKTPEMIEIPGKARVRDLLGNEIDAQEGRIMIDSIPRYIVGQWG